MSKKGNILIFIFKIRIFKKYYVNINSEIQNKKYSLIKSIPFDTRIDTFQQRYFYLSFQGHSINLNYKYRRFQENFS